MADRLNPGETLRHNESISSQDGSYSLVMQEDGNLVIYRNTDNKALWQSKTFGFGKHTTMQEDGNLVVYNLANEPVWESKTHGRPGSFLVMQSDGNLVIYQPIVAVWDSKTIDKP